MLPISLFTYSFALWLGLYLVARDVRQPVLRNAGLGLVTYALALCGVILIVVARTPLQAAGARAFLSFIFVPPLFWLATMVSVLPEEDDLRLRLRPYAGSMALLAAVAVYLLGVTSDATIFRAGGDGAPAAPFFFLATLNLLVLLAALVLGLRGYTRRARQTRSYDLLLVANLFFALGSALLLVPLDWLSAELVILGIAPDLLLLGAAVAFMDAFAQGEALWPDLLHSLTSAGAVATIFGVQVALVMWLFTGVTFSMVLLLLLTLSTAIGLVTFSAPLSAMLDRLALSGYPAQLQERLRLQAEGKAALHRDFELDPLSLTEAEFARLTRRAFSNMGNLPRLASSPLARLPQVDRRLEEENRADTSLERANALRDVLADSTKRLKPGSEVNFGSGDEWRFYNALYFPYVVGLRPYSRRASDHDLSSIEREALDWFRREVPQRTLYNWQTAAAELVARDLRERAVEAS